MAENHIVRLTRERDEALATVRQARESVVEIMGYLQGPKFHGVDADFVHVSTDMMPKLRELQFKLIEG